MLAYTDSCTNAVGQSKTKSGTGRVIPLSGELFDTLTAHAAWFTQRFGDTKTDYYLFPHGQPAPKDPTRPLLSINKSWYTALRTSGVKCRFHDLRHTALTKMTEADVPEGTMKALAGHMSAKMLERYSHVRMAAKRRAVESMTTAKPQADDNGVPTKSPTIRKSELVQ